MFSQICVLFLHIYKPARSFFVSPKINHHFHVTALSLLFFLSVSLSHFVVSFRLFLFGFGALLFPNGDGGQRELLEQTERRVVVVFAGAFAVAVVAVSDTAAAPETRGLQWGSPPPQGFEQRRSSSTWLRRPALVSLQSPPHSVPHFCPKPSHTHTLTHTYIYIRFINVCISITLCITLIDALVLFRLRYCMYTHTHTSTYTLFWSLFGLLEV